MSLSCYDPHIDQFLSILDALYDYIPLDQDSSEFHQFKENAIRKLNLCSHLFEPSIFYIYKKVFMHLSFYETYREYNFGTIPVINFNYVFKPMDQDAIRYYRMLTDVHPTFKNIIINNFKSDENLSNLFTNLAI
jgi:hypothetical protein